VDESGGETEGEGGEEYLLRLERSGRFDLPDFWFLEGLGVDDADVGVGVEVAEGGAGEAATGYEEGVAGEWEAGRS
jgi:hypothetical protein